MLLLAFLLTAYVHCCALCPVLGYVPLIFKSNGQHPPRTRLTHITLKETSLSRTPFTRSTRSTIIRRPAGPNVDDSINNPSDNWYAETPPFDVVRHYFFPNITDEMIETEFLQKYNIQTMLDLKENLVKASPFMDEKKTFWNFCIAVAQACQRIRDTAESVLGGQVIYDQSTIVYNAYDKYNEDAISVTPSTVGSRDFCFTLVSGPSGSGKTMFALRRLPFLVFPGEDVKSFVCVHFRTILAYEAITRNEVSTFSEAVAFYVQHYIALELSEKGLDNIAVTDIDLNLIVVLDEAGATSYKFFIDSKKKILLIAQALQKKMKYKFKRRVHVALVGTGLELSTLNIDSVTETTKFKMQAWTSDNFDRLVDKSGYASPTTAKQVVRNFPILTSMVANARCAYFLLDSLPKKPEILDNDWTRNALNNIIYNVVSEYIRANALKDLTQTKEKWEVARSVFREIDKATMHPKVPFFPQFESLDTVARAVAISLVDIQVESKGGQFILQDNTTYAVSMSPALFIVLAVLLNGNAGISWDWEGFECTVALGEWKRMVAKSKEYPSDQERFIVRLSNPVPPGNAKNSTVVPKINKFTVVINGPRASYADVIAPYRLTQAKFSVDAAKVQTLDLQNELNKMGLTNSSNHTKQQAMTTVLYEYWNQSANIASVQRKVARRGWISQWTRSEYYPSEQLIVTFPNETPAQVKCFISNGMVTFDKRQVNVLKAFDKSSPVDAVFVTNCREFALKRYTKIQAVETSLLNGGEMKDILEDKTIQKESTFLMGKEENIGSIENETATGELRKKKVVHAGKPFRIGPQDVDSEGKLNIPLPDDILHGLRDNVEIRFLFATF